MTRIVVLLLVLSIPLGGCAMIPAPDLPASLPHRTDRPRTIDEFLELQAPPRVIAHRGVSGLAPENTLAAFRKAIELGADMVELDVTLSRDGEVVVIHDDTLDRTTSGQGAIGSLTLAELRELDAGSWFGPAFAGEVVPTLGEVLEMAQGKILLNVEIKSEVVNDEARGGIADKVVTLIRDTNMVEEVIISSFDPRALRHVREIDPEVRTASLYNRDLHRRQGPLEIMADVGSSAFNVGRRYVTRSIIRECHAGNRLVAVYTVNEPAQMRRMLALGANALFTDRPDLMLQVLEQD